MRVLGLMAGNDCESELGPTSSLLMSIRVATRPIVGVLASEAGDRERAFKVQACRAERGAAAEATEEVRTRLKA